MTKWTMIADLRRCVGCQTCTAACKHANATSPAVQWRKVLDMEVGTFPDVGRAFVPVGCMHCSDPPCMHVCPSTATGQRADGIVTIDYDICIGCAYCAVACPYQARYKVQQPKFAYGKGRQMLHEARRESPDRLGVAQKCTWCADRIDEGLANGLTPGLDPRATPACVNSCIADALHFGDAEDPASNVSKLLATSKTFRMHAELGTDPNFHYVYQDADGDEPEGLAQEKAPGHLAQVGGVEPWLQQHWDWRAAGNFIGGGTGGGLAVMAALAAGFGTVGAGLALAALAFVALGLFMVFLETGRPLRAPLNVFFHPQTSWMTREAMIAALLFPAGLAAAWFGGKELAYLTGALGLIFVYAQGRILTESKGIPAWRTYTVVPLVLTTGLTEGAGLLLAATSVFHAALGALMPVASGLLLVLLAFRAWAWMGYRRNLSRGAPERTNKVLERINPWLLSGGHLVPMALIVVGPMAPAFVPVTDPLAGVVAAAAGWIMKYTIITRASYNQGFAITRAPERGQGGAGAGVQPGWQ